MKFSFRFGNVVPLFEAEQPKPDPNLPCPRARAEMERFDALPGETRCAIADSKYGAMVADSLDQIVRAGASPGARKRLEERGLAPCDVGTEGVLLEELAIAEDAESDRIRKELHI